MTRKYLRRGSEYEINRETEIYTSVGGRSIMKYRKKTTAVDAFQMTREAFENKRHWPEWLASAWFRGYVNPAAIGSFRQEGDDPEALLLREEKEQDRVISFGDWLITSDEGLICIPNDRFENEYEAAEPVDPKDDPEYIKRAEMRGYCAAAQKVSRVICLDPWQVAATCRELNIGGVGNASDKHLEEVAMSVRTAANVIAASLLYTGGDEYGPAWENFLNSLSAEPSETE